MIYHAGHCIGCSMTPISLGMNSTECRIFKMSITIPLLTAHTSMLYVFPMKYVEFHHIQHAYTMQHSHVCYTHTHTFIHTDAPMRVHAHTHTYIHTHTPSSTVPYTHTHSTHLHPHSSSCNKHTHPDLRNTLLASSPTLPFMLHTHTPLLLTVHSLCESSNIHPQSCAFFIIRSIPNETLILDLCPLFLTL